MSSFSGSSYDQSARFAGVSCLAPTFLSREQCQLDAHRDPVSRQKMSLIKILFAEGLRLFP
jgi:hypothetical protein